MSMCICVGSHASPLRLLTVQATIISTGSESVVILSLSDILHIVHLIMFVPHIEVYYPRHHTDHPPDALIVEEQIDIGATIFCSQQC